MLNQPLPDLNSWVRNFSQLEIPVLAYSLGRIHALQSKLDDIGIRDITRLIRHDPLLSLRLIRYLATHRHNTQVTDVTTLDRVMLMVGISGFLRAFSASPTLEMLLNDCPRGLRHCQMACSRAFLAARIAEAIANRHNDVDPEEVVTAALLHNTAEVLFWIAAPVLGGQVLSLMRENPTMRSRVAQKTVLGITLQDLQLELVQVWDLPPLLHHLLDEQHCQQARVQTVSVATALSRHLDNSWHDAGLPDDYKAVAQLTGLDLDEAVHLIQQVALSAAHDWRWFNVTPAAARLIEINSI